MALPPTIPTSFVPRSLGVAKQRFRSDFTGAFDFLGYGVFGIVFVLALGVFLYGRILAAEQTSKDNTLTAAEQAIDRTTVEGFVHLRNRLNFSVILLKKHVAFSNFFTLLETTLPTNVRFSTLHAALDSSGMPKIEGSGIAKSFNALAAVSTAFANDGRIKDAIFSKISINKDNSVSFDLSATLDPGLVGFSSSTAAPNTSVSSTTSL
jgi:hypothetical protein